ncbi:hypothetical protein GPECTOR_15g376 [Gonium pectorale]|uniref:Uncharacterized protein n=1 Tax=Gonium pectorale TaxID=33097 RepID=A0A150GLP6_GONPE|nr:hypothetical protein GPECTOR_15g376 [Gonium pectorale]|eukprot:KXZ50692.1 hypothetical protein GPECTOR_15g376 [Gonium pectorale]
MRGTYKPETNVTYNSKGWHLKGTNRKRRQRAEQQQQQLGAVPSVKSGAEPAGKRTFADAFDVADHDARHAEASPRAAKPTERPGSGDRKPQDRGGLPCNDQQAASNLAAQRSTVEALIANAASTATCPTCRNPGRAVPTEAQPAIVVFWEQPVAVSVPAFYCDGCRSWHGLRPTALECLPHARSGWDLTPARRKYGTSVIWWHRSVLQRFDQLSHETTSRIGAERFCATMASAWELNGANVPAELSCSALVRRLRKAVQTWCKG